MHAPHTLESLKADKEFNDTIVTRISTSGLSDSKASQSWRYTMKYDIIFVLYVICKLSEVVIQ